MTKKELIKIIAERTGFSKDDCETVFDEIFREIPEAVSSGGKFRVPNFGIFEERTYAKRDYINPSTHERITIPEKKVLSFRMSSVLSKKLNDN